MSDKSISAEEKRLARIVGADKVSQLVRITIMWSCGGDW